MYKTKSIVKNSEVKCTSPPLNPTLTVKMANNCSHLLLTGDFYIQKLHFYVKIFFIYVMFCYLFIYSIFIALNIGCYLLLLVNNSLFM